MKKSNATYQLRHYITSITMLVMLLWLTVSSPFVVAAQMKVQQQSALSASANTSQDDDGDDEHSCTPIGSNTTEEKTSNGFNSLSEEYLHMDNELFHLAELSLTHTRYHSVAEYVAFHGELLCPPPNRLG
jgi:hypothetical protein